MKKTIIIALSLCGLLGFTSCKNLSWSQVQTQIASVFTLDSTTAVIVSGVLDKHPETLDLFKKISADIVKLSEKDVLTLDEVKLDIQGRIADSDIFCKTDVLNVIDKIFDKISTNPEFNIAAHKDELLDVSSGIDWAVRYYEDNHDAIESTVTK